MEPPKYTVVSGYKLVVSLKIPVLKFTWISVYFVVFISKVYGKGVLINHFTTLDQLPSDGVTGCQKRERLESLCRGCGRSHFFSSEMQKDSKDILGPSTAPKPETASLRCITRQAAFGNHGLTFK